MEFVPALAMAALVVKVIDFLRYLRAADLNGVLTQLCTWIAGVVVLMLVAQTAWADGIQIGDRPLSTLSFWSQLFAGLTLASTASVIKDIGYKAIDNHNTTAIPTLLPEAGPRAGTRRRTVATGDTATDVG